MIKYAMIRENDEIQGEIIYIGYKTITDEETGQKGFKVCASNNNKIGYYAPKTKQECIRDIHAMYASWQTFKVI